MASEAAVPETRNRKTEVAEIIWFANSTQHGSERAAREDDVEGFKSTCDDAEAMKRMGRNQQLVRHYRLFSMVSFIGMATASWERTLYQVTPALRDGGLPSLVYSNLWIFCAFTPVVLSLAEMASMAPIAGAQYHWVSEFAPEKYQRFLSYMTGYAAFCLSLAVGDTCP